MTNKRLIIITAVCGLFGFGCANDPVEFSQAQGVKRISINVEPADSDAVAGGEGQGATDKPVTPATEAGEEKVRTLLEGFDTAGGEDFDADAIFDQDENDQALDTSTDLAGNQEPEGESAKKETSDATAVTDATDIASPDATLRFLNTPNGVMNLKIFTWRPILGSSTCYPSCSQLAIFKL